MSRRRVLSRAERLEGFARRMQLKRDAMTPAELDALMRRTIDDRLDQVGAVTRDDLVRANLPPEFIDMHFRRLMMAVLRDRAQRGIVQ